MQLSVTLTREVSVKQEQEEKFHEGFGQKMNVWIGIGGYEMVWAFVCLKEGGMVQNWRDGVEVGFVCEALMWEIMWDNVWIEIGYEIEERWDGTRYKLNLAKVIKREMG